MHFGGLDEMRYGALVTTRGQFTASTMLAMLVGACGGETRSDDSIGATGSFCHVIDFETPALGPDEWQLVLDPYVDPATGVSFEALSGPHDVVPLVGLVPRAEVCASDREPSQKLGTTNTSNSNVGRGGYAVRATFPDTLPGPVAVSVELQVFTENLTRCRRLEGSMLRL
jgi:hypothetical protein